MKKKSGKFLSLVLALVLCLGLVPMAAGAADSDFVIENGVLVRYNGSGGDVAIPDGVTAIGESAFGYCEGLTSVTIPNSVTSVGGFAFAGCSSLTDITIPSSVTSIDWGAFQFCEGLTSVTLSDGVIKIGEAMFYGCNSLTSVTIPATVTTIGGGAFADCALANIEVDEGNTVYCSVNGMLFTKDMTTLVQCPGGKKGSVTVPDGVTTIGDDAFQNCDGLTGVTIADGVTTVGNYAFYGTSLTSVTIPASVTTIGSCAFDNYYNNLTIYGVAGSYAQTYAEENGIPFVAMNAVPTAYQSTQSVLVDGTAVEFQCYALKDSNGNLTNYIKLRDLADILNGSSAQFQVGWDGSVTITTKSAYTSNGSEGSTPFSGDRAYSEATSATKVNGQTAQLNAFVLNNDTGGGYTYYQLRDLGQTIGFNVGWSADKGIFVETDKPYDPAD